MANGGRLVLSEGVFNFESVITVNNQSNITIEGQGLSTQIKLANGVNPSTGIINFTGTKTYNYAIKNLLIDGNYANQTGTGSGIYMNTLLDTSDSMQLIEDVEVRNCIGSGFNLQQGGQLNMRRCRGTKNRIYGFNLNASDGVFDNLIADNNIYSGIYANCFAGHYKDCKAYYNANGQQYDAGIYVKAYNSYFVNCEGEDNYYNGMVIDGAAHGCIINNCIGDSNGQTSGSGLVIYGDNNVVMGGAYYE
ncbi:MAG: hypothetical protein KGJ07_07480, partial [Patescibacteria group bacterium]|nr:hypothetical protein [Patescibacteria group bacterium]